MNAYDELMTKYQEAYNVTLKNFQKNPKLGPVTDIIDTLAEFLLCNARFCQAGRMVVVHSNFFVIPSRIKSNHTEKYAGLSVVAFC